MLFNDYVVHYVPCHHKAMSNGCVYEHILIAEKILGRELNEGECVHHKDGNKKNNSPDNLMIFKSIRDHTAYHGGAEAALLPDGTYEVKDFIGNYDICPICNKNMKWRQSNTCRECYKKIKATQSKCPSKSELKDKMTEYKNFSKVAELYEVSSNAIVKWCKKYNLPWHVGEWKNM